MLFGGWANNLGRYRAPCTWSAARGWWSVGWKGFGFHIDEGHQTFAEGRWVWDGEVPLLVVQSDKNTSDHQLSLQGLCTGKENCKLLKAFPTLSTRLLQQSKGGELTKEGCARFALMMLRRADPSQLQEARAGIQRNCEGL